MYEDWGNICVIVRLEKMVDNQFFTVWTNLIMKGLRPNDAVLVVKDRVAHIAANEGARAFLKSNCDTAFFIDSDCDIGPGYLEDIRSLQDEWQYDILQGFYTRRGWPPEAVWFKDTELGDIVQCLVWKDNFTEDTAYVGLHNTLIRRRVFEKMLAERPPDVPEDLFTFFYYPQNRETSEDATFSFNARELGFRVGSTTKVKAGHISRVTTGWETYQEQIRLSGILNAWDEYFQLSKLVADFTGESVATVQAKAIRRSENTLASWQKSDPKTPQDVRAFYGLKDSGYLYDLLGWNLDAFYHRIIAPLKEIKDSRVLVVGAGLGGEVKALEKNKNIRYVFELPGALRKFLRSRFGNKIKLLQEPTLADVAANGYTPFDLIVAVDVVEHIHPAEFEGTMDAMLSMLAPDGRLYLHINFDEYQSLPQAFDHRSAFDAWCEKNEIRQPEAGWGFYERVTHG